MAAWASELVGAPADRSAAYRQRSNDPRDRVAIRSRTPSRSSGRARGSTLKRIAICTDSSSLLALEDAERLGIEVVPIGIALDGEPFDDRSASVDDFYERLRSGAAATTSLPGPAAFAAAYERAAARGAHEMLSIHLDARTSGTVTAAELAARDAPLPVRVVDTRTASYGVGLCVRAAAEVVVEGGSLESAANAAMRLAGTLENAFVARLGSGGRVPASGSWALLTFRDGVSTPISECASASEAAEALAALVPRAEHLSVAVGHAARDLEHAADELARMVEDGGHAVERYRVGPAIGAHTGPDSFGLFWWPG